MNDVFKQNPNLEKYFSTSDGEAFYNQNDAKNHAKSLEDKTVKTVYNESFLDVNDSEDLSPEAIEMAEFEKSEAAAKLKVVTDESEKTSTEAETTTATEAEATSIEAQAASTEAETTSTEVEATTATEAETTSTEAEATEQAPKKPLSRMNKDELIAFAKENALELDETLTNPKMVESLTQQLEAKK